MSEERRKIFLVGFVGDHRKQLKHSIKKLKAIVEERFSNKVQLVVCYKNSKQYASLTKAKKANIPIVSESYIIESEKQEKVLDYTMYNFSDEEIKQNSNSIGLSNNTQVEIKPISLSLLHEQLAGNLYLEDVDPIFINRSRESILLAQLLCLQKTSENGILPILSQHYGSGKTMLVEQFRNVIEKENLGSQIGCTTDVMSLIMNSVLVVIDFQVRPFSSHFLECFLETMYGVFKRFKPKEEHEKFERCLKVLNVCKTCIILENPIERLEALNVPEEIEEICASLLKTKQFSSFFQTWSRCNLWPVLLFFDEFQCLERGEQGCMSLVQFWKDNLTPLMGKAAANIFTVVAGKSSNLTKLGRGLLLDENGNELSPSPGYHLVLDMLTLENIIFIMENTELVSNCSMKEFLSQYYQISEHFEYFCNKIYIYTGGIPRMIKYVLTSMIKAAKSKFKFCLKSREAIDKAFDNFEITELFSDIKRSPEITHLAGDKKKDLEAFTWLSKLGTSIPFTKENVPIIDQLHDMNVGVEQANTDNSSALRIVIPKFTLGKIKPRH